MLIRYKIVGTKRGCYCKQLQRITGNGVKPDCKYRCRCSCIPDDALRPKVKAVGKKNHEKNKQKICIHEGVVKIAGLKVMPTANILLLGVSAEWSC